MFVLLFVLTLDDELVLVAVVVISVWVCEKPKLESINKNGTKSIFINQIIHLAFQATLSPTGNLLEQAHLKEADGSLSLLLVAQR